jgi:hypothetical protein
MPLTNNLHHLQEFAPFARKGKLEFALGGLH